MHHNEEEPSLDTNRESLHIALRTQHSQKLNKQINPKRKKEKRMALIFGALQYILVAPLFYTK